MTRSIIVLFLISLINLECKKPEISPQEACREIEQLYNFTLTPLFRPILPIYSQPCINPNDPNELIYIITERDDLVVSNIIKYNIETKTESTLHQIQYGSRARWSKKDWILFVEEDHNLYKIKSNGDSLTQLTFTGTHHNPEWNITGDKFISRLGVTGPDIYPIYTDSGNPIDTSLVGIVGSGSWRHPELTAYTSIYGPVVGNPAVGTLDTLFKVENVIATSSAAEWIDQEQIIWTHQDGIRITNINTNKTTLIRETCNAKYYANPTYSSLNNKVIFQVIELKKTNKTGGVEFSYLARMNIDGSEEKVLKFLY